MKILHAIGTVNPAWGGPVEGIKQLGSAIVAAGHQVEVVCLDSPDAPWSKNFPLPVHALGPALGTYGFVLRWVPWFRQNLSNYDVVIVNGIWQYHSFGTWRALKDTRTPYLVFTHGALDPWFKRQYPLKHLKKWMYWPWAEYRVLRDAQAVLFTCEEERVLAQQSFWLYRCNEVVVGYGTSSPQGDPKNQEEALFARHPELRGRHLALYMGRIHPRKGCDLAIQGFAAALGSDPSWQLVIAGPDQTGWKRELLQMAEAAGISNRITWTGTLGGDAKWGALRAAQVLLLPSHGENFGIVVVEALACGTPVLISDKVNIWREVHSDGAGMVAVDNPDGAASLLRRWLAMTAADQQMMKVRATECFRGRFEVGRAAERLLSVIRCAAQLTRPNKQESTQPLRCAGPGNGV